MNTAIDYSDGYEHGVSSGYERGRDDAQANAQTLLAAALDRMEVDLRKPFDAGKYRMYRGKLLGDVGIPTLHGIRLGLEMAQDILKGEDPVREVVE